MKIRVVTAAFAENDVEAEAMKQMMEVYVEDNDLNSVVDSWVVNVPPRKENGENRTTA